MTSDTGTRSRLRSTFLLLTALTAACTSVATSTDTDEVPAAGSDAGAGTDSTPGRPEGQATSILPDGPSARISVDRVADGDSLRATGPDGPLEIRLLGLNAPERDDCAGPEARAALENLLDATAVELRPWPGDVDEFGRHLALLTADGVFVNLALLEGGHAVARAQSDHGFAREFEEAEQAAAQAALGMWAPDACGPAVDAEVTITEINANAPGDDRQNPNGEWVLIRNDGSGSIRLGGWSLRDESTRHRFEFPSIDVEAGREVRVRSGCGDDDTDADPIELFWCDPEPPVWNNDGDTAFLHDPNGGMVAHRRTP